MSTTKKQLSFEEKVLANLNKSEKDLQKEKVAEFKQDAIIETETQISTLKVSELAKANLELDRAKNALEKAKANQEKVKYAIPSSGSFSDYFNTQEEAREQVFKAELLVDSKVTNISIIEEKIKVFENILLTFKG